MHVSASCDCSPPVTVQVTSLSLAPWRGFSLQRTAALSGHNKSKGDIRAFCIADLARSRLIPDTGLCQCRPLLPLCPDKAKSTAHLERQLPPPLLFDVDAASLLPSTQSRGLLDRSQPPLSLFVSLLVSVSSRIWD